MTGATIRAQGAARRYAGRNAGVGPIDADFAPGDFVAVVGPSGCGKSTLLRLVAGLEQPSEGKLEVDAQAPGETAMVFQAPTLLPWASAADNVSLPLKLLRRDDAAAPLALLERVGLRDAASLRPAQLSGGMAMRVSLARALVTNPRLLLLDEPFAALDALTRRALADDLLSLWGERAPTVMFVTHDVEEAVYLAQRVLVLGRGPGRIVGAFETQAPFPRPPHYRATALFRDMVEQVTARLAENAA